MARAGALVYLGGGIACAWPLLRRVVCHGPIVRPYGVGRRGGEESVARSMSPILKYSFQKQKENVVLPLLPRQCQWPLDDLYGRLCCIAMCSYVGPCARTLPQKMESEETPAPCVMATGLANLHGVDAEGGHGSRYARDLRRSPQGENISQLDRLAPCFRGRAVADALRRMTAGAAVLSMTPGAEGGAPTRHGSSSKFALGFWNGLYTRPPVLPAVSPRT
eukprot:scaffold90559_cov28-Tisochrysis_lutea.AAC.2